METKWNKFKGGLNAIIDIAPFLTLIDEVTYYQWLMTYVQAFPNFRTNGVQSTSSVSDGSNAEGNPHQ
jgi:hypothetical protein